MTVYHCIDQFVKVNFMATYEKNPFFSGFRIFYWAVLLGGRQNYPNAYLPNPFPKG
jgi:hypothetical protein